MSLCLLHESDRYKCCYVLWQIKGALHSAAAVMNFLLQVCPIDHLVAMVCWKKAMFVYPEEEGEENVISNLCTESHQYQHHHIPGKNHSQEKTLLTV